MDASTVLSVVDEYRKEFQKIGVSKSVHCHSTTLRSPEEGLEHCHSMLSQIEQFVAAGDLGKAFRWLGFIQGYVWRDGMYTLTELKGQNSPMLVFRHRA